jgi:hypothetical protein
VACRRRGALSGALRGRSAISRCRAFFRKSAPRPAPGQGGPCLGVATGARQTGHPRPSSSCPRVANLSSHPSHVR